MQAPASEKDVESKFPFVDLFIGITAGQHIVVGVLKAQEQATVEVDIGTQTGLQQVVIAVFRFDQGCAGIGFDGAGTDTEVRRYAPLREGLEQHRRRHDLAIGELPGIGVEAQLRREVARKAVTQVERQAIGTGKVAVGYPQLKAVFQVIHLARIGEIRHRAIGRQGEQHVAALDPALQAAAGFDLDPVGAAFKQGDDFIALDHMENRIARAGPCIDIQKRIVDGHLQRCLVGKPVPLGLCRPGSQGGQERQP
ncbi:hypothetical protein CJA_3271 [Cellvibrio japonicus Ueda107]|uniref:Uncharacterized protein n=1 Tax=Cellvibrio japonicus (strain Ueda107) TaxID=498211 RepID=B3PEG8_CELJU|nr:hypothetical protein CJA_3271 [Cellvibrio japonicus Ueda107]